MYFILLRLLHLFLFYLILLITSVNFTNKINLNFTRHHQLQDTIPQHCGESTGRRSEWVLLQVWKNTINISWNPHLLPPALQISGWWCAPGPASLNSWPPSSRRSSTDQVCEVPSWFKHSTIIPVQKKPKITGLNYYRPVVTKSFEKLVLAYLKDITGPLLDPLKFAFKLKFAFMMQSTWDCTSSCSIWTDHTLKKAGLNTAQCWVNIGQNTCWDVFNQQLGYMFNPTFWAVTQPLGKNNPIAGFVHILPSAGLYLT